MSILGKLLAIANVLGAVAFLYLAASDWALRHRWTYSVYRHELALTGLPVDDQESDPTDDAPHIDKLSDKTLQDIFQQAGGAPVKTQKAEVEKVRGEFKSAIDALPEEAAKRKELASRLVPLARTRGERDEMRNRIATKPLDELMSDVDSLFQISSKPPAGSMAELVMPREEKTAIAHLLYTLQPGAESQARLQAVLGLRALSEAIARQASAFHAMEEQTYRGNVHERTNFEVAHKALTDRLAFFVNILEDRKFTLQTQLAEKRRHQELLDSRQKEHKEVIAATEEARDRHKKILDAQRAEEQNIFQSQQLYHRTRLENEQLERAIRELEKQGGEGKKQ